MNKLNVYSVTNTISVVMDIPVTLCSTVEDITRHHTDIFSHRKQLIDERHS
jgi:hypothetical protein